MQLGVPIDLDAPDRMEQIRHNIELLWKEHERILGLDGRVRFVSPVDFRVRKTIGNMIGSPALHKSTHQNGGSDEINVTGLSGALADPQVPVAHKTRHQDGGDDEIAVAIPMIVTEDSPTDGDLLVATGATTAKWAKNTAYVPSSLTKNAGGAESGAYTDLALSDGVVYTVAELAATPGFDIEVGFTGVVNFNKMFIHMRYDGSLTHDVFIRIWNYNTLGWDLLATIHHQNDFTPVSLDVSPTNHISAGAARVQFYHNSAGNAAHDLYLDQVLLQDVVIAGDGVTDHGTMTGLLDDDHTQYQQESEKDAASGYAGLNASSRTVKGVDTTDDLIVDLATKGLVLKDTQGTPHYWRVTVTTLGALVTTDLGTTKP